MLATLEGIAMVLKEEAFSKQLLGIAVKEGESVTAVRLRQSANAPAWTDLTDLGMP